jgi:putative MATE family efflux protein
MTASIPTAAEAGSGGTPRFVTGSILRHILVMTATSAVGLMAIFLGDLANIFFLGLLRDVEIVAAVGYASSVLFFATSIGIGLAIATTALVSPALGASDRPLARRLTGSSLLFALLVSVAVVLLLMPAIPWLLAMIGAAGRTHALAARYLAILVPSMPFLVIGICAGAVLRSTGDAARAMHVTLTGAVVNVLLDPLLIFGLKLGLEGAAIASFIARIAIAAVGIWGVRNIHDLLDVPDRSTFMVDARLITRNAVPAVLTNVATPVANAYVTAAIAAFGDSAVAAWAIIGRIMPVAFGAIFALSGAVGPIIGQNYGARRTDRVQATFIDSLKINAAFTLLAWLVLLALAARLPLWFGADAEAARLVELQCRWLSPLFVFLGALFIANAVFNTLGWPHYATMFNWGRATLGTWPLVKIGGMVAGAPGVLAGQLVGGVVFGVGAALVALRVIRGLADRPGTHD